MLTAGPSRPARVEVLAQSWKRAIEQHRQETVRLDEKRAELVSRLEAAPDGRLAGQIELLELLLAMSAKASELARAAYVKVLELEMVERGGATQRIPAARARWFARHQRSRAEYAEIEAAYARLVACTETLSAAAPASGSLEVAA